MLNNTGLVRTSDCIYACRNINVGYSTKAAVIRDVMAWLMDREIATHTRHGGWSIRLANQADGIDAKIMFPTRSRKRRTVEKPYTFKERYHEKRSLDQRLYAFLNPVTVDPCETVRLALKASKDYSDGNVFRVCADNGVSVKKYIDFIHLRNLKKLCGS